VDRRRRESEVTDGALVSAARRGDTQAFEALLLRHEGRVLRLLRLFGIPAADREDVAQEVFVRVFRHLRGFRPGRSFTGWIYRITVNAAHDYRHDARRRAQREDAWDPAYEASPDGRPGAGELLELEDSRRGLERTLERLSGRERAVFVLCELEELSTREVARALGINAITVRRHLGRARDRLRALLAERQKRPSAG
jgi:RNA polymerase sigma-70 factor (ECF subfamily)